MRLLSRDAPGAKEVLGADAVKIRREINTEPADHKRQEYYLAINELLVKIN
jgi:hypothetical protein